MRKDTDDVELLTAVMYRHVAAFTWIVPVGEELAHEVLQSETTLLKDSRLSILGENDIFGDQS